MNIDNITPLRAVAALQEETNTLLAMLAHYKPNIKQTIESDIWAEARTHSGLMSNLPLVTQEVILTQLTDAIIEDTVAKHGSFYEENRNEQEYVLGLSIGEAIEWYVDHDTVYLTIVGEKMLSIKDIDRAINEIIQEETTVS